MSTPIPTFDRVLNKAESGYVIAIIIIAVVMFVVPAINAIIGFNLR